MGLKPYLPQFKAVVLGHLKGIADDDWNYYRHRAALFEGDIRAVDQGYVIDINETRESVLDGAIFLDSGPSVEEILKSSGKFEASAIRIGEIEGHPVYYIDGHGIYLWGKPQSSQTISFWATFPAYPPGW